MSDKKVSWADIADEEDAERLREEQARKARWVPPHERQAKQKLKDLFSREKEKPRK
jgi:hypothetical protein